MPIVPAQPGFYAYGRSIQLQERVILDEGISLGKFLNRTIRKLREADIPFELKLEEGEPHTQIEKALAAHDPELVIIAGEPYGRFLRLFLGELITPLLRTLNRPILIAVPARHHKYE